MKKQGQKGTKEYDRPEGEQLVPAADNDGAQYFAADFELEPQHDAPGQFKADGIPAFEEPHKPPDHADENDQNSQKFNKIDAYMNQYLKKITPCFQCTRLLWYNAPVALCLRRKIDEAGIVFAFSLLQEKMFIL
jgi:hypothetical protein